MHVYRKNKFEDRAVGVCTVAIPECGPVRNGTVAENNRVGVRV